MLTWLLFLKLIDGEYVIVQSGSNIVPTEEYDKVLPTTERIARQSDKVFFDGEKLNVKEGKILLTIDELNNLNNTEEMNVIKENTKIYDI
ncbi:hypothetical protein [Mammaliicoccus sciuri]|uniref:hypothetical protein n=1 Tax=Mammaliicoccus sciuri TaxID=1296 RepID=UPI002DBD558F|nr:hypothetical protein [Mammaliicoccus sciuri]MEB6263602.1 hypothetical protein [Mammaliicoccus sciuri]